MQLPLQILFRDMVPLASMEPAGVIVSQGGETYHFDRSHVAHPDFEHLAVGQAVRFLDGVTRAGREARRIVAVQPTK